jgi:hypothetical protein
VTTRRLPPKPSCQRRRQSSAPFRQPPDQASSSWTSQGSSELARMRKTSSCSPDRMRRTVCRLLPVRRTICLIGTPWSASVRTAAFVSSRREASLRTAPLRAGQQLWVDGACAKRTADRGHRPLYRVEEGAAGVLHQMPSVGDLSHLRGGAGNRVTVAAPTVARDDLDGGMIRQPRFDGGGFAVGEKIDDFAPLEVAEDAAVAVPALPRPVVDADHPRCRLRLRRPRPDHPREPCPCAPASSAAGRGPGRAGRRARGRDGG